jgi:ABC-2 type transport system ATP-binding protein
MEPQPVIEVRQVRKAYKAVQAVDGVDLAVYAGQFTALLGPNGAGKTTLVEMIEGIQAPDQGEILIMGKPWKGHEEELRLLLGISLQETRFIDKLTVTETLRLFASFYGIGDDRIAEVIGTIGLEEKSGAYVVNLSGGQRQRLALGVALLHRPPILLLDEPTTGFDPNARREVWSVLLKLKENAGTTLILTTHYMEEAEQLCDRIVILDKGRVLKQGTLKELLGRRGTGNDCSGKTLDALFMELTGDHLHV